MRIPATSWFSTSSDPAPIALLGELVATQAKARGVAGILVDGAVRDLDELTAIGLPIWARFVRAQGATKGTAGKLDVPVVIGGADIRPGDVVVMDCDGALALPSDRIDRCCRSHSSEPSTSARCGRGTPWASSPTTCRDSARSWTARRRVGVASQVVERATQSACSGKPHEGAIEEPGETRPRHERDDEAVVEPVRRGFEVTFVRGVGHALLDGAVPHERRSAQLVERHVQLGARPASRIRSRAVSPALPGRPVEIRNVNEIRPERGPVAGIRDVVEGDLTVDRIDPRLLDPARSRF